jgi:hypothetical protein
MLCSKDYIAHAADAHRPMPPSMLCSQEVHVLAADEERPMHQACFAQKKGMCMQQM